MKIPPCILSTWKEQLAHKTVIVRVDYNTVCPETNTNMYRLTETLPTIDFLLQHHAKIILITHQGNPKKPSKDLSNALFVNWFTKHGYATSFAPTLAALKKLVTQQKKGIIIFENIRFFTEETTKSLAFAQAFKNISDYFVQDAFATLHRDHTTITVLPTLFTKQTKSIGFLVQKELSLLNTFLQRKQKPFVLLQGGNKISTKLPLITEFLSKISTLILSTPLCFTFLKAENKDIGHSLYESTSISYAKKIQTQAEQKKIAVIMPSDFIVAQGALDSLHSFTTTKTIAQHQIGITPGPQSIDTFCEHIMQAQTVLINGLPGLIEYPETLIGTKKILDAIKKSKAYTLITGGDTLALVEALGCKDFKHLSTGGGATLTYLSKQSLVGLDSF